MGVRYRLIAGGMLGILLALLAMGQAANAYDTSYQLFQNIAVVNRTTVDAAESALQFLAGTSQATANYTALTNVDPLYEQSQSAMFRNFRQFQDQMFILRSNLRTPEERTAYNVAETYTYSRYWRHVGNLIAQRDNISLARQQYFYADDHLRNQIMPALRDLEALNFNQMVAEGTRATSAISTQALLLAVPAFLLAGLLTALSFWLRRKVRRYLTPGLDLAAVIAWAVAVLAVVNLFGLPGQIHIMTQDAYNSVSGSSRALVDANLARRAESSAIIDPEDAATWEQRFNTYVQLLELRLCGQPGCLNQPFANGIDVASANIISSARSISATNLAQIDNVIPLMGNITFKGEVSSLEAARKAFVDYLTIHRQIYDLVRKGDVAGALALNIGSEAGQSAEAFDRFTQAMTQERTINRTVFDQVWNTQSALLTQNRVLYSVVAYGLIVVLIGLGLYHRFREL
jgi:hypothetical protein